MRYRIEIDGTKPLLMHQDNVMWSEKINEWRKDPDNKKKSVAGDDRSPGFTWIGALYHDDVVVTIPSDNIMTMLREGGASVLVPGARGNKTFKAQTQSGIIPLQPDWVIYGSDGAEIEVAEILNLELEEDFSKHVKVVEDLGFELFVKRARIGQSKHIRVRPLFREWRAVGDVEVVDDQITEDVLRLILTHAGQFKGIGDWRPSSKTPGGFGTFTAKVERIES